MHSTLTPASSVAAAHTSPHACLNCGTGLHDQYCAHCGQPADTHRITTGHLLHEIPHSIWHVDKGLLFTLREMVLRPGAALRAYLAGQRRPYFAPISYLLLLVGVSTFLMAALHIVPFDLHDPRVPAATRQLQQETLGPVIKYMSWYQVLMLPVTALFTRQVLRRGGLNYAECIVVNAFAIGTASAVNLVFIPAMYLLSGTAAIGRLTLLTSAVMFGLQARMYAQLLAPTALSAIGRYARGLLTSVGNFILLVLLVAVILVGMMVPRMHEQMRRQHAARAQHQPAAPAPH
ncbi:DUF3667 domain-containing protein [Hymenobacter sp. 15J16-1T3B]|uniref:DUF3667 domain-containing protein n=1 Tax=Hymenobacter sp. 15J16-1T3B TaxID=2886941 RepID=UPI001D0F8083|nr:DUF3667 domain-containing protein [Hymenobacter sp. 15J16-1T3B]MCC3160596.1 DUF3667 domain-containing protein [Hymenobacter sp. 15J16-1T3B]